MTPPGGAAPRTLSPPRNRPWFRSDGTAHLRTPLRAWLSPQQMPGRSRSPQCLRCKPREAVRQFPRGVAAGSGPSSGADTRRLLRPLLWTRTCPQVPARLDALAVAIAELTLAEDDGAVDPGRDHGLIIAIDHASQAAVKRNLFLVVAVHRFVQAGRIDHHAVRTVTLPQRARADAKPLRQF